MRHDALELPSGSFELADLERIGNDAAAAENDAARAQIIRDGLAAANQREDRTAVPGMLPDHKVTLVNRVIEPGIEQPKTDGTGVETVGRVVVQEEVQVYDPTAAEAQDPATQDAGTAGADVAAGTADAGA